MSVCSPLRLGDASHGRLLSLQVAAEELAHYQHQLRLLARAHPSHLGLPAAYCAGSIAAHGHGDRHGEHSAERQPYARPVRRLQQLPQVCRRPVPPGAARAALFARAGGAASIAASPPSLG